MKSSQHTIIVTIDGPAASGKTSVSRDLATKLGWSWVSTGAFYRGLAYVAQRMNIPLNDENLLADLCLSDVWSVQMSTDNTRVFFQGEDVSVGIYAEENGSAASKISQYPRVRAALLEAQRHCADNLAGLVAEGRDCGTVVFPWAQVKIYLVADSESRALRRSQEQGQNFEEIKKAQSLRDLQDSSRAAAPMQAASDAHIVDTSEMTLSEVVERIHRIVRTTIEKSLSSEP
jgi:CMP/dCMP kinase